MLFSFFFFLLSFKSVEWLGLVSTSFITNLCSVTLLLSSFTFYGTHRWQYCRAIRNIMCGYKNASRYIYIATAWHPPCWMSVAWKPPSGCLFKKSLTASKGWISMLYHGVVSVMMLKPPLTMTFFCPCSPSGQGCSTCCQLASGLWEVSAGSDSTPFLCSSGIVPCLD